jgi:hypothetical protein
MKRTVLASALAVAVAAGWLFIRPAAPVAQPLAFNHAAHAPTACRVCHDGVETAVRARIPGPETCARCHAAAPPRADPAAWAAVQTHDARWVRVTRTPDHVAFSHQRHVALANLACESCHGDTGTRSRSPVRAVARLDMDACVSCHRRQGATDECNACHR